MPADDAQVLERLPGRERTAIPRAEVAAARAAVQAPNDPAPATALATAYVRASRAEGDPRFLGYAQAALAPWWKDPEAPTAVLMLRATILQSRHEFDAAGADLDRMLQRDPRHAQALLTRATVLTVRGKYAEARDDCDRLLASGARVSTRRPAPPRSTASPATRDPRTTTLTRDARRHRAHRRRRARLGRDAAGRNRASPRRPRRRTDTSARRSRPTRETCICWARTAIGSSTSSAPADVDRARRQRNPGRRAAAAARARATTRAAAGGRGFDRDAARALRGEPRARRHRAPARERALRARPARRRAKRPGARARQLERAARAGGLAHPRRSRRRRRRCCRHGHRQAMAGRDGIRVPGGRRPVGAARERRNETLDRDCWRCCCARASHRRTRTSRRTATSRSSVEGDSDRRAVGHRAARSRLRARARREPGRRDHVGRSQGASRRHRRLCADAAALGGADAPARRRSPST